MKLSDFDFDLPEDLIATRPAVPRSASRLLVATRDTITDAHIGDLRQYFRAGDRLVLNDTKVIPARLCGHRLRTVGTVGTVGAGGTGKTTAQIQVTLLGPRPDGHWSALIKPLKKVKDGEVIVFDDAFFATMIGRADGQAILSFNLSGDAFDGALARVGSMPLPPYIAAKRPADARDNTDYQTVFARHLGAVAAPTASLHFDQMLLDDLAALGVETTYVTLHVGAGTFLPVKVDDISAHKMHAEWGEVGVAACAEISATKSAGGRIIPVGTTALRLIETASRAGTIAPWSGDTDIFIRPGFQFNCADALLTNFHLPKSTLMMLVSALIGQQRIKDIYKHAITNQYRFFSYGDASLLIP